MSQYIKGIQSSRKNKLKLNIVQSDFFILFLFSPVLLLPVAILNYWPITDHLHFQLNWPIRWLLFICHIELLTNQSASAPPVPPSPCGIELSFLHYSRAGVASLERVLLISMVSFTPSESGNFATSGIASSKKSNGSMTASDATPALAIARVNGTSDLLKKLFNDLHTFVLDWLALTGKTKR